MIICYLSVYVLISVGWIRPYVESSRNKWELFQECFVFLTFYHLFCVTDFAPIDARPLVGLSMMTITCVSLISDGIKLCFTNVSSFYRLLRKLRG